MNKWSNRDTSYSKKKFLGTKNERTNSFVFRQKKKEINRATEILYRVEKETMKKVRKNPLSLWKVR